MISGIVFWWMPRYMKSKKFGFNDGKVKKYLIDTGAKWSKK